MAASGSQTIQLYYSTTSGAAPSAGNLTSGEFAVNITDGKLYYKDNAGAVQVLATKGTGAIGGSNTQVQYNNNGSLAGSGNLLFDGTTLTTNALSLTNALTVGNGGTGATTLTGYVKGNGTSAMTASSTIPNTDISGLGTMSTQNANSVAITGGTVNGTSIGATTASTGSFTSLSDSGNLTFTGTGNRITGDFSNATIANRVMFQTSTTNANTIIGAIPNGTSTTSGFSAANGTDTANTSWLDIRAFSTEASIRSAITGTGTYLPMTFYTGGSERVRIDTSGNVGIGTSSPGGDATNRVVSSYGSASSAFQSSTTGVSTNFGSTSAGVGYVTVVTNSPLTFATNNTERARIDSSGNLLVGTTSADGKFSVATASTTQRTVHASSGSGSTTTDGVYYAYVNQARGTGFNFMRFQNTSAIDFQVLGNGNVQNTNNSYGAISDIKLKENIVDATPKLEKLKQVRVVNYNFKGSEQKQLGVIAQEIEQIFPGIIEETPDRDTEGNHLGTTTKSVKYSVFVPMLIKAMQEQQAQIEQLRAEIQTLKGN